MLERNAHSFREMNPTQRTAAFGLVRASVSAKAMGLVRNIMRLNEALAGLAARRASRDRQQRELCGS